MKVVVTGAAGFIGSSLIEKLVQHGDTVIGIDNFCDYYSPERKRANLAAVKDHPNVKIYEEDFRDRQRMLDIFEHERPDKVAHLGAMGSVRYSVVNPELYITTNILGTSNLLEAAVKYGVPHFVFASTSSVYGQTDKVPFVETDNTDRPLAPYPASKKAGEVLGHAFHNMHGLQFTALRFFNVYGPKGRPDMMPYIVLDRIVKGEEILLFDGGEMHRDWTYIDDILAGVTAALENPFDYEIFNLGRGEPVRMVEFMQIAEELAGKAPIVKIVEAPKSEPKITFANVDKATRMLNYRPRTSLRDGLQAFWGWYTANCQQI